jgi:hypothetical protein
LPACIMNRSENFSIINLEIKFKWVTLVRH